MRTPSRKLLNQWRVELAAVILFTAGVSLLISDALYDTIWPPGIILLLGGLGGYYIRKKFEAWGFELREDHLYIEHGVLKKVKTTAPFVRIQHIDTQRGVLDRVFGISKVVIYTAGSRGADITIPGLSPEEADEMQEKLRDVAIASEDRDAV